MTRTVLLSALLLSAATPALAKDEPVALARCDKPIGTVALVDGDTQGWTKYGLGSPRELIAALASESGCFGLHNPASGAPASFLLNVIAGDKEEVDKNISMAKGAAAEALVRSGAAGRMLGGTPFGGAALKMFGGMGGKKKTVAAAMRLISPASGQTLVSGTGEVTKTSISFGDGTGGIGGTLAGGAQSAGYASSKDGQMLAEAFIKAFNAITAQRSALASVAAATPPVPNSLSGAASSAATVAVDAKMLAMAKPGATVLRALRAGTTLKPTGQREGMYVEAEDGFGTKGWVSVEDLK